MMIKIITCPFCDHEVKAKDNVVKCWNCGECFEVEPDEEDFLAGSQGFSDKRFF